MVSNEDGRCWRTEGDYTSPPDGHVEIRPDNWHWREGVRFAWKEHPGRGYWQGGERRDF
jgi:hypothetical protein